MARGHPEEIQGRLQMAVAGPPVVVEVGLSLVAVGVATMVARAPQRDCTVPVVPVWLVERQTGTEQPGVPAVLVFVGLAVWAVCFFLAGKTYVKITVP